MEKSISYDEKRKDVRDRGKRANFFIVDEWCGMDVGELMVDVCLLCGGGWHLLCNKNWWSEYYGR